MKKTLLKGLLLSFVVALVSCFRPDDSAIPADNKLIGYWEVVHSKESDKGYIIEADGSHSPYNYIDDFNVSCNDGKEMWNIFHFTDAYVTLIATDDPEMAMILDIPVGYTRVGNTLTSLLFEGDLNNEVTISFEGDDTLILYKNETGFLFNEDWGRNEEYMEYEIWLTLRRVKSN